jgi:hypothetical protein
MIKLLRSALIFEKDIRVLEKKDFAKVGNCGWNLNAYVRFVSEQSKRYQVGFIQVLDEDEVKFTYTRTVVEETHLVKLPVLDGSKSEPPFHQRNKDFSPVVDGVLPPVVVQTEIDDRPTNIVFWNHKSDPTDKLERVDIKMKFRTWLAVRDITGAKHGDPPPANILKLLKQWKILVQYEYRVDTSQPRGGRFFPGLNSSALSEVQGPLEDPPPCIWAVGQVANNSIGQQETLRAEAALPPQVVAHAHIMNLANNQMVDMAIPRPILGPRDPE